jgi:PKD repeat protein
MEVKYYLDGVDFKTYGVSVSDSSTIGKLKMKEPAKIDWPNYHGDAVDLRKKFYKSRDITLDCYIKADNPTDFIAKFNAFSNAFDKAYTNRLTLLIEGNEPIPFEVYVKDGIDPKKKWNAGMMVGTFTLVLNEPEPVKKVLKYTRTGEADKTVSITVTSTKMLNIYWGDGEHTFDVSGTAQTITHNYTANGTFYVVITGCIDEIASLTTTGTVIWAKI